MAWTTEDADSLLELAGALWPAPDRARAALLESLAVSAAIERSARPEVWVNTTARALLRRAEHEGPAAVAPGIAQPFYRLSPTDRLALVALHRRRWSYARLAHVLREFDAPASGAATANTATTAEIGAQAWAARLQLPARAYPSGGRRDGTSCPEYDPQNPWTNRFLDDELTPREKHFLQSHALGCGTCKDALIRCRELYYEIDATLPRTRDLIRDEDRRAIQHVVRAAERMRRPSDIGFVESLGAFGRQNEVRWAFAGLLAIIGLKILGAL